jgi:hypothetical protein
MATLEVRAMSRTWFGTFVAALSLAAIGCASSAESSGADDAGSDSAPVDEAASGDSGSADSAASTDAPTQPDAPGHDAAPADAGVDVAQVKDAAPEAAPTTLDLHQVTLFDNPANLADWPVTTLITDVEFQYMGQDGVHVEFSKQDGAGSWPDVTPPGWTGPLEYTLGFVENIGGQWYGSAAVQFWRGLAASGGNVAEDTVSMGQCAAFGMGSTCQVAKNWYYDGRWGNLAGYQPSTGETIGVFVVAGNVRGVTDGSQSPVQERSNVVLVQMPTVAGAKFTF